MTKRRMMLVFLLCFLIGGVGRMTLFQACSLASDSNRSAEMSLAQSKREGERTSRQFQLEFRRRLEERRKEAAERERQYAQKKKELKEQGRGPIVNPEERRKAYEEACRKQDKVIEEAGGIICYVAKMHLGGNEERWKLIQPKLKKVQDLRPQAISTVGAGVSDGSSDRRTGPGGPKLKWDRPWKDKPLSELTEAQRLATGLRTLLERKDTTPAAFRSKMAALREARSKDLEIARQLAGQLTEARRELRQILTTREEAILVLLGFL